MADQRLSPGIEETRRRRNSNQAIKSAAAMTATGAGEGDILALAESCSAACAERSAGSASSLLLKASKAAFAVIAIGAAGEGRWC